MVWYTSQRVIKWNVFHHSRSCGFILSNPAITVTVILIGFRVTEGKTAETDDRCLKNATRISQQHQRQSNFRLPLVRTALQKCTALILSLFLTESQRYQCAVPTTRRDDHFIRTANNLFHYVVCCAFSFRISEWLATCWLNKHARNRPSTFRIWLHVRIKWRSFLCRGDRPGEINGFESQLTLLWSHFSGAICGGSFCWMLTSVPAYVTGQAMPCGRYLFTRAFFCSKFWAKRTSLMIVKRVSTIMLKLSLKKDGQLLNLR